MKSFDHEHSSALRSRIILSLIHNLGHVPSRGVKLGMRLSLFYQLVLSIAVKLDDWTCDPLGECRTDLDECLLHAPPGCNFSIEFELPKRVLPLHHTKGCGSRRNTILIRNISNAALSNTSLVEDVKQELTTDVVAELELSGGPRNTWCRYGVWLLGSKCSALVPYYKDLDVSFGQSTVSFLLLMGTSFGSTGIQFYTAPKNVAQCRKSHSFDTFNITAPYRVRARWRSRDHDYGVVTYRELKTDGTMCDSPCSLKSSLLPDVIEACLSVAPKDCQFRVDVELNGRAGVRCTGLNVMGVKLPQELQSTEIRWAAGALALAFKEETDCRFEVVSGPGLCEGGDLLYHASLNASRSGALIQVEYSPIPVVEVNQWIGLRVLGNKTAGECGGGLLSSAFHHASFTHSLKSTT
eukprot:Blabericola_migrator_1__3146@NODE_191_length_11624_cov_142_842866_g68_i1_p3_GENE_NODE_191_length_11624_cov_142_842866_g68_i1NODE_191_length_11624_cov_142_842866_g68_i1_p3_ORF_typecomplete_len409_score22_43_NODE_191_length_11624_cov_142_842866_g68_i172498475